MRKRVAASILSVARWVSRPQSSERFLCNRSSSSNLLTSRVEFVPDSPDTRKLKDILERMDHSMEECKKAKAELKDLVTTFEKFRAIVDKLGEYHKKEGPKYVDRRYFLFLNQTTASTSMMVTGIYLRVSQNRQGLPLESEAK